MRGKSPQVRPAPARDSRANLERETGFEPATSTLARSHSTTELLPLVFSFYCTCAFRDNSLHPRRHPLFLTRLFCIGDHTAVREETLDKLGLSVPRLVAIVNVVHRHNLHAAGEACAVEPPGR